LTVVVEGISRNAYAENNCRGLSASGRVAHLGRWIAGAAVTVVATAIKCFLVLWRIVTLVNMWVGVSKAGYSIKDEVPMAVLVFAVPAMISILIWWRSS
jgi:hypothetical protein